MFTYNVQLAGYDFSQADYMGAIDLDDFLLLFKIFPGWSSCAVIKQSGKKHPQQCRQQIL